MSLKKKEYIPRLIDPKIERYLKIFGAVSIEGPKWCGKTWTGLSHANSVTYMTEKSQRDMAEVDPKYIFTHTNPQLVDEWQIVPGIWDAVRHECDSDREKGKFILTGSTSFNDVSGARVYHSGTGRIAVLRMHPMSLYESGDSTGRVSLTEMQNGTLREGHTDRVELERLAYLIVRGGWPENISMPMPDIVVIPGNYIEALVTKDMHEHREKKRNPNKMRMLLRSLARKETSMAGVTTLVRDIAEYENESQLIESRGTLNDYLNVLDELYLTANQESYSLNYRSSSRIGKTAKRHLVDSSLCCAALHLTVEKLLWDHETFGLLFESLVERDLRIYAESMDGHLYHFRDNVSGEEVDAILEFKDGSYAAFEIKLSDRGILDALQSLSKFNEKVKRKPIFSCVIVGHCEAIMRDPKTGIYIVPATELKP